MISNVTLKSLHDATGGRLRLAARAPLAGDAAPVGPIAIDSRLVERGGAFWALRGSKQDGADFVEDAYSRGAAGVVANRYVQPPSGCWSLQVEDGGLALEQLARWNRERSPARVVAVTGSVGKTTARQMIRSVLETRYTGSASPKNFNNHIGLPLAMLEIEPSHDFAVLELGASERGEIARLAALSRPEIAVITRTGDAHLGGFGSRAAIAESKAELLEALDRGDWAVLNGDDPMLRRMAARLDGRNVIWCGKSLDNDLVATDVHSRQGILSFRVDGRVMTVPVWGRHHVLGALAAVAVGRVFGLSDAEIARGLARFEPPPRRCQVSKARGATIIDDSYNASPVAMRAALELLRDFEAPGRRIVVCGDMRELGHEAPRLHRELGDQVVTLCGADMLYACGEHAPEVVAGARAAGMPHDRAVVCGPVEELCERRQPVLEPGDVVLVKGSRAMALERVVQSLLA